MRGSSAGDLADIDDDKPWKHVTKLSVYLSRTQDLEMLKGLLRKSNRLDLNKTEFEFIDGFARDKVC